MRPLIAVWFSCGAASAVAAKITLEQYSNDYDIRVVNNPVMEEDIDNRRFMSDVQQWLGIEVEISTSKDYPLFSAEQVWKKRRYMSGPKGAPCTVELKKRARQQWENLNHPDWHVLGFTVDEVSRHNRFIMSETDRVIPILINAGFTKQNCADILKRAGIHLPAVYEQGYPNANCIGCVKASSPTYWNHVRLIHPDVFERRASLSKELGTRLVLYQGKRIFLSDLPPDAKGKSMKSMKSVECGIFCEERSDDPNR